VRGDKDQQEECGNEKTPVVGKERGGKGMGWDGEWMKPPTAMMDDIYWMKMESNPASLIYK
jgi:hypothetical protein